MILTAHQPAYLPWLGLFHKIALADAYVYVDNVQFEKESFVNRNKIVVNGEPTWLTVPVKMQGHISKKINEMQIDNDRDWKKKHWQSIYQNYKKTPYFNNYAAWLEDVYKRDWNNLADLCDYMLKWFLDVLGIKVKYYIASAEGIGGSKSDYVLNICQKLKANLFIFGALGKNYAKPQDFDKANIKMYFQEYNHPTYKQASKTFLPYMSVLDLLFNYGDKSLEVLMGGNITKAELHDKFKL